MIAKKCILLNNYIIILVWFCDILVFVAGDVLECFGSDMPYTYSHCCAHPPNTQKFNSGCWNTEYTFERCCIHHHGPNIHALPVPWTNDFELTFPNNINSDSPRDGDNFSVRLLQDPLAEDDAHGFCLLWNDMWPRYILSDISTQPPEPVRHLDLACGIGLNGIIGTMLGWESVAVDVSGCGIRMARQNAALNNVTFALHQLDICDSVEDFQRRVGHSKFSIITVSELIYAALYPCVFRLIDAVASDDVIIYSSEYGANMDKIKAWLDSSDWSHFIVDEIAQSDYQEHLSSFLSLFVIKAGRRTLENEL